MNWDRWKSLFRNEILEETGSDKNPLLEVAIENGKTVLNTRNGNFSFGNLHKVFDETFKKINIKNKQFNHCLLLGLGGGSVLDLLVNKYHVRCPFSLVEYDAKVVELAKKYFHLDTYENTHVYIEDAFSFVGSCEQTFDLIIVDLYNDLDVPEPAHSKEFTDDIIRLLQPNGMVLFNKVAIDKIQKQQYKNLYDQYAQVCRCKTIHILGMNNVLVAEKL